MNETNTETLLAQMNELQMAGQEMTADRLQAVVSLRAEMTADAPFYVIPATSKKRDKETDTRFLLNKNGAPAAVCTPDELTAALEIDTGERLPGLLFIVKEGRSPAADRMKTALEAAKMKGANIPDTIVTPTEKPLLELAPSELTAWLAMTSANIEREKEKYQHTFGADLIDLDNEAWERGQREPLSTGFPSLDQILDGGLYPEALYSIGALSSLGKTTFVLQIADHIAANGRDILYVALEQSGAELRAKTLSRLTDEIDHDHGRLTVTQIMNSLKRVGWKTGKPGYMTSQEKAYTRAVEQYRNTIGKHMRIIEGVGNITVSRIRGDAERNIRYRGQAPVVIIDYTQILAPAADKLTDKQNVDRNIVDLKRLARDLQTPVIAVCSFNRDNYFAPVDKNSFKESGSIEYSADVLIGLQPFGMIPKTDDKAGAANKATVAACMDLTNRFLEAVILKNRNGAVGTVMFDYYTLCNRYTDKGVKPKAPRVIASADGKKKNAELLAASAEAESKGKK